MTTIARVKTVISAMLITIITSIGSNYGEARTDNAGSRLAPGQTVEVIVPTVTVVSTRHYQAMIQLSCGSGNVCNGFFPNPGKRRQHHIKRVSCRFSGTSGSTYSRGNILLLDRSNNTLLFQPLAVDFSSTNGYHTLTSPVDFQVGSSKHIGVAFFLASGNTVEGTCLLTGTLSILAP